MFVDIPTSLGSASVDAGYTYNYLGVVPDRHLSGFTDCSRAERAVPEL